MPESTCFPGVDASGFVRSHCRVRDVAERGTAVAG